MLPGGAGHLTLVLLGLVGIRAENSSAYKLRLEPHLRSLGLDESDVPLLTEEQAKLLSNALHQRIQSKVDAALASLAKKPSEYLAPLSHSAAAAASSRQLSESVSDSSAAISALRQHLLSGYSGRVPPRESDGRPVNVQVGLNLYRVIGVDMDLGVLHVHVWMRMAWHDPRLAWDPDTWNVAGPISMMGIPAAKESDVEAWVPEVDLLNGEGSTFDMPRKELQVRAGNPCHAGVTLPLSGRRHRWHRP